MPLVPFTLLPDSARVWVFGSAMPLEPTTEQELLRDVDAYLDQWKAHGAPLTVGRDWREQRFLTIAVDISSAAASGCSIDGLFRVLQQVGARLGTSLVESGGVYYRTATGEIASVNRTAFTKLAEQGAITREVRVFDTTVPTLGDWRTRFETPAGMAWTEALIPA